MAEKINNSGYLQQNHAVICDHRPCSKWAQYRVGDESRNEYTDKREHLCCGSRHCYPR